MLIVPTAVHGYEIEAVDGRLGTVTDFLFDDRNWRCRWLVVDTGGWLTGRSVLIHPSALSSVDHGSKVIHVDLTQQQVKDSPTIQDHQPITMATERSQFDYYSWDPFWGDAMIGFDPGGPFLGAAPMTVGNSVLSEEIRGVDQPDPNLRSIADVTNYHVEATDGDIGHVQNMLIDDSTFAINFLILNTSDWWMGKSVLISPKKVTSLKANERYISLSATRDQIKSCQLWDPAADIQAEQAEMEDEMAENHNWPGNRGGA